MPEQEDWHGWRIRPGHALHIGHLPDRSSVALYQVHNGLMRVLAYFKHEQAARFAMDAIDQLTGMKEGT